MLLFAYDVEEVCFLRVSKRPHVFFFYSCARDCSKIIKLTKKETNLITFYTCGRNCLKIIKLTRKRNSFDYRSSKFGEHKSLQIDSSSVSLEKKSENQKMRKERKKNKGRQLHR